MSNKKQLQAEAVQKRLLELTIKGLALKKAIAEMNSEEVTRTEFVSKGFHGFFRSVGCDDPEVYFSVLIAIENDLKAQLKEVVDELIENELLND